MATLNFSHFLGEEVGGLVFSMFVGYFTFVERLPQLQLYTVVCVMRWNLALYSTNIIFLDSWKICIFQLYKPWTLHKTRENLLSHFDGIRSAPLIPWTKQIVVRDSCDLKHLEGGKIVTISVAKSKWLSYSHFDDLSCDCIFFKKKQPKTYIFNYFTTFQNCMLILRYRKLAQQRQMCILSSIILFFSHSVHWVFL